MHDPVARTEPCVAAPYWLIYSQIGCTIRTTRSSGAAQNARPFLPRRAVCL